MNRTFTGQTIAFPRFAGLRCLMMPYIQGDSASVPGIYAAYKKIIDEVYIRKGDIGFLTIDESPVIAGKPHRGQRATYSRALHTEAGKHPVGGGSNWGGSHRVILDSDVKILLANNLDDSCAVWNAHHADTSLDGDIGHVAKDYPYSKAIFLKAGDVHEIGILTPHESIPVATSCNRQFLRIVSSGVHGREEYFTENSLMMGVEL